MQPPRLFRPWNTATRCRAWTHAALAAGLVILLLSEVVMTVRRIIAPVLIGLLALAGAAAAQPAQDPETTTMVPELETLHEIIMPLWHDAWPKKDVAALRRFVPELEARAAKLYIAPLPGILREMKGKWDQGMAALRTSVEAYKTAAAGQNDQQLLDAAEAVHARFEELFYGVLRPLPPAVDAFHKVLYVVYHRHLPNKEYARIGPAAEEMVAKAEAVRKARLPARLSGRTGTYQQAAEALQTAAAELLAATRTSDGAAIERAVETLHARYRAVQEIFE